MPGWKLTDNALAAEELLGFMSTGRMVGDTSTNPADARIAGGNGSVARDTFPIHSASNCCWDRLVGNMPLASGEQLGNYKIQSLIGKGGMGEVYRALDTKLAREAA